MARAATIDELIALNDEILALTRAGVPLEAPLLAGARGSARYWKRLTQKLADQLERGVPLGDALDAMGTEVPGPYRAVVKAGLRAGKLPAALEGVGRYARAYADLRTQVGLAALSPLIVLIFAYALFVASLLWLVPKLQHTFESLGVNDHGIFRNLDRFGSTLGVWGLVLPVLLMLGWLWWSWGSTGRQFGQMRGLATLPWLKQILGSWRTANFSGWLSLLVEHGVPLDEGLVLAAEATGDPKLVASTRQVAENVRLGVPLAEALEQKGQAIHPWLRWELAVAPDEKRLAAGLARTSEVFSRKASRQAELVRMLLPALLMIAIGGLAAALSILTIFLPWTNLLRDLGAFTS